MVVSAAKLEANRRNAQKSTGPRTQEGKDYSKMNAVTHGCRSESLIVLDEDPGQLEARRQAWFADLLPRSEAERRAVDDAVVYSWMQDRARRAEAALADARLDDFEAGDNTTVMEEVVELGRRLFLDRAGPIEFYPTASGDPDFSERDVSTSLAGNGELDVDDPEILILQLQSTLEGCEWLLSKWAKLKRTLDLGQKWLSSDKLRAVRLLGRQPLDAIDDEDVALVYLASFALAPDRGKWDWEIIMELNDDDNERFRRDAAARQLESRLKPADAAAAREALQALIAGVTASLTAKAEAFCERACRNAARAADLLAFDPSVEAERLRRHELASGRAMARSLDTLLKLRRSAVPGPSSADSDPSFTSDCPLSAASDLLSACVKASIEDTDEAGAAGDAFGFGENSPNEPNAVPACEKSPVLGDHVGAPDPTTNNGQLTTDEREVCANEPNGPREDQPNQPALETENRASEPTGLGENSANEATGLGENRANELGPEDNESPAYRNRARAAALTTDNGPRTTNERANCANEPTARDGDRTRVVGADPANGGRAFSELLDCVNQSAVVRSLC